MWIKRIRKGKEGFLSFKRGETVTVDSCAPFPILQEQQKYAQLQEIIKKLDEEKKRGDSLLYAMIPKAVADRLRKGITALETCQVQDSTVSQDMWSWKTTKYQSIRF